MNRAAGQTPVSPSGELLARASAVEGLAQRLEMVGGREPVVFEDVAVAARGFVAALIAKRCQALGKTVWFACANLREQEEVHNALSLWVDDALFFPQLEMAAVEGALPDAEIAAERLGVLERLASSGGGRAVVVVADSLEDPVPAPEKLKRSGLSVRAGQRLDVGVFIEKLAGAGYDRAAQVTTRGEFAVRGGIIDVYSWQQLAPVRIELFGDEVDSLREFDVDTQMSVRRIESANILPETRLDPGHRLGDEVARGLLVDVDAGCASAQVSITSEAGADNDGGMAFMDAAAGRLDPGDFVLAEAKRDHVLQQIGEWLDAAWLVNIVCANEGEEQRLKELMPVLWERVVWLRGELPRGFVFPAARLAVLADAELFGRFQTPRARRGGETRRFSAPIDFTTLSEGDLVVHLEHGIGRFEKLAPMPDGSEVLVLEYADDARLYVPVEQAYVVSRYVGLGKRQPQLSSLGGGKWARAIAGVERSVQSFAARLLQMHAERETREGFAFSGDQPWQIEFEASFPYKETPDQLTAIAATKSDMEDNRPMDRLICGDVGFGKTEVAIRAAFKAVMDGKQVAVLAPTTVLAQQHYQTFRERMSDYPVRVDVLSRFRTHKQMQEVIKAAALGNVDIVIGTHRLISGDVKFKDLGLVIIDEEQRFGVLHKEQFKAMFSLVDQLTLSATPIPRTLYLSLMGAKDMSSIETPPPNRYPVETVVCAYDERIMRDAIDRELGRRGQVYVLHNRVGTIEMFASKIQLLCPDARVDIGHGQMSEHELEDVMARFVGGGSDVLVATTIIESGIDIPNANTIIIDRADRFGLADLYQLRGRVGRAHHKAYAYLLLPRDMTSAGAARKRINAIKQYSSLGAGFKVAMRDLEIRGAGNILGTEQSGHVVTVGFELYCTLLRHAIAQVRQEAAPPRREVPLSIDFLDTIEGREAGDGEGEGRVKAYLPRSYIPETRMRIDAYRELAQAGNGAEVEHTAKGWRDRFGPLPASAENLLLLARIKLAAAALNIQHLEVRGERLMLRRGGDFVVVGGKFPRLTSPSPILKFAEILEVLRAFASP